MEPGLLKSYVFMDFIRISCFSAYSSRFLLVLFHLVLSSNRSVLLLLLLFAAVSVVVLCAVMHSLFFVLCYTHVVCFYMLFCPWFSHFLGK